MGHAWSIGALRRTINGFLAAIVVAVAPAMAVEMPGTEGRVTARGWIDGLGVVDTGGGPRQFPWARSSLGLDAELTRDLSFALELRGQAGGPYRGAAAGFLDWNDEFENKDPALAVNQAYLGWRLRDADLRAGVQLFAWGKLDGVAPTDVLNPRDYHNPLVDDVEERKIGVPALSATYYVPLPSDGTLSRLEGQLVYVPIAVPPRLALERERWFPTSIDPTTVLSLASSVDFGTANDPPARTLGDGGIGFRLGGTWGGVDWDAYYYGGPETLPDAALTARVFPDLSVVSALVQEQDTIHMFGADTAVVVGPVSLRAEAAYFLDRPFLRPGTDVVEIARDRFLANRPDPIPQRGVQAQIPALFVDRDAVEWGIGADMVWEGFRPLVQISQIVLTEDAPTLLIGQPETRITALVRKAVWQERVEFEVRTVYTIESGGWFALPRVSYAPLDDLRLRVGYLAVGGHETSLIGQFKRNDEVVFDVRWSY